MVSCSRATEIRIRPPRSVDLAAWPSSLTRTCSSRAGSASSRSGPGDAERVSCCWRSSIRGRTAATAARATAAASSRCFRNSIFPRVMHERSCRSSICRTRCLSWRSMVSWAQARSSRDAAPCARCRALLMAATGLRRSCASRPRSSSLLRSSSSSASRVVAAAAATAAAPGSAGITWTTDRGGSVPPGRDGTAIPSTRHSPPAPSPCRGVRVAATFRPPWAQSSRKPATRSGGSATSWDSGRPRSSSRVRPIHRSIRSLSPTTSPPGPTIRAGPGNSSMTCRNDSAAMGSPALSIRPRTGCNADRDRTVGVTPSAATPDERPSPPFIPGLGTSQKAQFTRSSNFQAIEGPGGGDRAVRGGSGRPESRDIGIPSCVRVPGLRRPGSGRPA